MDKTAYDNKVANVVSECNTYKPLHKDHVYAIKWMINSIFLSLHKSGHLSDHNYHKLCD